MKKKPSPNVFRRPDSPFWQCRVSLPSGRRIRRSTLQTHSAAAKEYADLLQRDLNRSALENKLFPPSAFKTPKAVANPLPPPSDLQLNL